MNTSNIEEIQETIYASWLNTVPGFGRIRNYQLLKMTGTTALAYQMTKEEITALFGERAGFYWQKHKETVSPDGIWEEYRKRGIHFVSATSVEFPDSLRTIPDPPFGIYYVGQLPQKEMPVIAMIGARRYSDYGRCMAEYFADRFGKAGIAVVSGMAMGIDGISQRSALRAGGMSFGVLGCSVDIAYPESNTDLYYQLIEKGGIISEYPPTTPPKAGLFPQRNRIISALSDVVLVVEAREKSGTLITVDMALEQGKDVYVIPGRCTDHLSLGCNKLLRQGAAAATCPEDILQDMGWITDRAYTCNGDGMQKRNSKLSYAAADILSVLDVLPIAKDDIAKALQRSKKEYTIPQICQGLLELELTGLAASTGGLYRRTEI